MERLIRCGVFATDSGSVKWPARRYCGTVTLPVFTLQLQQAQPRLQDWNCTDEKDEI